MLEGTNTRSSGTGGCFPHLLKYQDFWSMNSTLKELYCLWSSLRCIKCWVVIYYRGFKFPRKAVVLLLLESDAAGTILSGHSAGKSAVSVFKWFFKAIGDGEQDLRRYWPPEGWIKQWYYKPTGYGFPSKECCWWINKAVTLLYLVPWPSSLTYRVKTQDSKHYDSHHWPESPLM